MKNKTFGKLTAAVAALIITVSALAGCVRSLSSDVPDPSARFYVSDNAGVIGDGTEQEICSYAAALDKLTGAQIVIVTVDQLDGIAIDRYAEAVFNKWGIGSAEKNNGVLLLMALAEDNYWAVQGVGLEQSLTSGTMQGYLDESLEPYFAKQDYDGGARSIFGALYSHLCTLYGVNPAPLSSYEAPQPQSRGGSGAAGVFVTLIAVVVLVMIAFAFLRLLLRALRGSFSGGPHNTYNTYNRGNRGGFGTGFILGSLLRPRPPHRRMPPPRGSHGGFGGFGGFGNPGSFGGRSNGPGVGRSRPGGFSGGRSGGFGGSRPRGGGGRTRGGGAGRR